jgi:hypothetical protein
MIGYKVKATASILAVGVFIFFMGWVGVKNWTTGGDESDYEIICIGGHQYYRANWTQKALLGIKLTDEGKPVKCIVK